MNKLKLTIVMLIWGSIGVFTKSIPLSALSLAFLRAIIALPVLCALLDKNSIKNVSLRKARPYIISGVLLGIGWLSLFYGFKMAGISSAVIIYNMCPIFVMIAAPVFLKERISKVNILVIVLSFFGLYLIVGNSLPGANHPAGGDSHLAGFILSGLSGLCYAAIVLFNRSIKVRLENKTATFIQICTASFVLLPFILAGSDIADVIQLPINQIFKILLLGIVHTGLAYSLFFSVYDKMKSTDIVAFSYLEPLFSILLSVVLLGEHLSSAQIIGGSLILGATYAGELLKRKYGSTASQYPQ